LATGPDDFTLSSSFTTLAGRIRVARFPRSEVRTRGLRTCVVEIANLACGKMLRSDALPDLTETRAMTGDDFRRITLALDGAIEKAHMGHPDFRVNGRIFATLDAKEEWGVVMLTPQEQREFRRSAKDVFVPAAGAWGQKGCTKIHLATADEATVRSAVILAWESKSRMPAPRARKRKQ
jgi:YjbR